MALLIGDYFQSYIRDMMDKVLHRYLDFRVEPSFGPRLGQRVMIRLRLPKKETMTAMVEFAQDFPEYASTMDFDRGAYVASEHHLVRTRALEELAYHIFSSMETWIQIAKDELKFKDILQIRDIEQRMVALKRYGVEKILHDAKAKLLHKSERGNELFLIPFRAGEMGNVFSQDAYYLKYSCPSTGRIYISGVPPEMGRTKDADACMAWKHGLSTEAYKLLNQEA